MQFNPLHYCRNAVGALGTQNTTHDFVDYCFEALILAIHLSPSWFFASHSLTFYVNDEMKLKRFSTGGEHGVQL